MIGKIGVVLILIGAIALCLPKIRRTEVDIQIESIPAEELTSGDVLTGTDFTLTDSGVIDLGLTASCDISFSSNSGPSVEFIWDDGKFDIRFDPDKLTESAKVFCEAIEPYINEHIIEKAKELNKEKEK